MMMQQRHYYLLLLFFILVLKDPSASTTLAFSPSSPSLQSARTHRLVSSSSVGPLGSSSSTSTTSDEFASFAASLDDDNDDSMKKPNGSSSSSSTSSSSPKENLSPRTWKEDLEDLLNPSTPMAKRQVLLADLLSANQDIRQSVETALREQKIDPLLTPRGKRIQDGTRAVARQLTVDILPSAQSRRRRRNAASQQKRSSRSFSSNSSGRSSRSSSTSSSSSSSSPLPKGVPVPPILPPLPGMDLLVPPATDLTKMGRRMLNALQNQVQNNLSELQDDLADPTNRIPQRLSQQTSSFIQEATNVFAETPVGLSEPPYTVCTTITSSTDYEIRDYQAYTVASTNILPPVGVQDEDESYQAVVDNPARTAAAFNTLAAYYLLGANKQQEPIATTLPVVTTTMLGEMRFYIEDDIIAEKFNGVIPEPLEQDEAPESSATTSFVYETGAIFIEDLPPARLAVRRFTGFCTAGEVARQKAALLAALELDDVELDVPHGGTVPHVVFQYNPPYALPVVRRNEIAVAVLDKSKAVEEASLRKQQKQQQSAAAAAAEEAKDSSVVSAATTDAPASSKNTDPASSSTSDSRSSKDTKVTKINGSAEDPSSVFPEDPWGENDAQ